MTSLAAVVAVYDGVHPSHLRDSLAGLLSQTLPPDEVLLVADGPLTAELDAVLSDAASGLSIRRIDIPRRGGSGPARQAALEAASADLIAIVDADDVSLPHRFETQVAALTELGCDVLGAAMEEVDADSGAHLGTRVMPRDGDAITRRMLLMNPINHPTLVARRSFMLEVGGYGDLPMLEDYDLMARLQAGGARMANLDAVLVRFRGGPSVQRRRTGRQAFASERVMQENLRRYGLIGRPRALANWLVRSAYRLIPGPASLAVYRRLFLSREGAAMTSDRPEYDRHVDMSEVRGPLGEAFARQALSTAGYSEDEAKSLSVLDVGAGYGDTGRALARRCRDVTCLEPARELHERSMRAALELGLDNMYFVNGGVEDMRDEDTFDLIVLDNVYEHLPDQEAAVEALWRALKPGGRLYLLTPNKLWPIEAHYGLPGLAWLPLPLANRYLRLSRRGRDYTDASYAPTYWSLRRTLERHGGWDHSFVLPGDPSATVAGQPWHYRVGMAAIRRIPALWAISKALLVVATKRPHRL